MHHCLIDTLQDPAVRDLAWVIGSPGLPDTKYPAYKNHVVDDAWCATKLADCTPWISALDQRPYPLHHFIAARPTRRLGHYFESLITYWLMHMPNLQIIATNLQVQSAQRTLGEFDFLFRDESGAICHWEVAVKFYLQAHPQAEQQSFIGPGTRDRLDLKMDRVFQHQLNLGYNTVGQQSLPAGVKLDKSQAFIKGYLFYHVAAPEKISLPGISSSHLSGWWARHQLENLPQSSAESHWIVLPRMNWLATARLANNAGVMSREALLCVLDTHFQSQQDALLLCELHRTGDGWQEISRGFVVCPSWPIMSLCTGTQ
jgi:hypothetical protein